MASQSYRDLIVWQKGIGLVELVYSLTNKFPKKEMYGLANQLQKCVVSIPSNIAEGQGRNSSKDFKRFLYIAVGSLAELDTQIEIAKRLKYIDAEDATRVDSMTVEIRKMLFGLIKSLLE